MEHVDAAVIRQHLIDPEICIRCNTCETTCPVGAITHDERNYVVDAARCDLCMACIPPCPTGSIDNWRIMPRAGAYSVEAQFGWDALPAELTAEDLAAAGVSTLDVAAEAAPAPSADAKGEGAFRSSDYAAVIPPWSAAHPYANLYGPRAAQEIRDRDGRRQRAGDRSRPGLRHPPHRARFRRDAVSGARGPVDRDRAAGRRSRRPTAPSAAIFDREPPQRRASRLQQRVAHGEARARGSPGPARSRRRQQLPVRSRGRRQPSRSSDPSGRAS